MNIAVVSKTSKLIPRVETPYTVVVQYGKKPRQYIKCETMAATRDNRRLPQKEGSDLHSIQHTGRGSYRSLRCARPKTLCLAWGCSRLSVI
jgi:hypothetical protein